ncbi:universal stress protein [Sphingomonas sp. HDW15A]|uniref:universal stress protein n=1 Tax=Sphingomonas sp. HDW15A TaxID=2714942 RepID=UPI00140D7E54|nr:universal stress protein [Sphingomonas sp. HDW15A]QIK96276.1 universal stress protein [Sphingomonas sp. HDW15A]
MTSEMPVTLDRPSSTDRRSRGGIKTILLHVQNDRSVGERLEAALSIARTCDAHLHCVHITPVEAYVAFDAFGGVFVMSDVIRALDEEEARLRARIEDELRSEDVSWDYEQVTGNIATQVVRFGALSDLVVTGRDSHQSDVLPSNSGLLADILHRSRTPLLVPACDGGTFDPLGNAVVAWDGSYEAANAVRASIGLLQVAGNVRIIQASEEKKGDEFPGTRLLEYLSRHDVHAELTIEPPGSADGSAIAALLVAQAKAYHAAYIVMGSYNHSRVGQYFFGGVTSTLLDACDLPLVMMH